MNTTIGTFKFDTIGFTVCMEDSTGFQITALAKAGTGVCPSLGVEDYRYTAAQRLSRTYHKGPFGRSDRTLAAQELAALRMAVREHLAAIDRGEIEA